MSTPADRQDTATYARWRARQAIFATVEDSSVPDPAEKVGSRLLHPGDTRQVRDILDPADALRAARAVTLAARSHLNGYVRFARESGLSWHEVGAVLDLGPDTASGVTVADAAFDLAAGDPHGAFARDYGRSVMWKCSYCRGLITDKGPSCGPREDETGHSGGCERLAADADAWDAGASLAETAAETGDDDPDERLTP